MHMFIDNYEVVPHNQNRPLGLKVSLHTSKNRKFQFNRLLCSDHVIFITEGGKDDGDNGNDDRKGNDGKNIHNVNKNHSILYST